MAAMGQLDCGQCGYLCQSYAEALADGSEASPTLCVPGAKATARMLKQLLAAAPARTLVAPAIGTSGPAKPVSRDVRVRSAAALTRPGSSKDVRHVVIDLAGSGLNYEPGDSIGLATPADPALVQACLTALGATGSEMVAGADGMERDLQETFSSIVDIARPLDRTTDLLAMCAKHPRHAAALRQLSEGADNAEPVDSGFAGFAGGVSIGAASAGRSGGVAAGVAAEVVLDRVLAARHARRSAFVRGRGTR